MAEAKEIAETYKTAVDKYGLISALERCEFAQNAINLGIQTGDRSQYMIALRHLDTAWVQISSAVRELIPERPSATFERRVEAEVPSYQTIEANPDNDWMSPQNILRYREQLISTVLEEVVMDSHLKIIDALQQKNLYLKQTHQYSKKNFPKVEKWNSKVSTMAGESGGSDQGT